MAVEQTITIEQDEIKTWAEGHGGEPAKVRGTGNDMSDPAVLRIDFSGERGDPRLERIEWDVWFEQFTDQKQAAMFAEPDREGAAPFFKIVRARDVF